MSEYSAWGGKPDGSRDPFVRGQRPLPPKKPDAVAAIFATERTAAQIEAKVDSLLEPPQEGEDRLSQIVELLQALTFKVEAIEARQARLEKAVLTPLDAIALSLRRIAAGPST